MVHPAGNTGMRTRWPRSLGLVEWFTVGEYERVERVLADLRALGACRLRTGVHWADCHRPDGPAWYDWLLPRLAEEVDVLPCFTYTPPSLGILPAVNAPPRDPQAYADFMDESLTRWGRHFALVELWNEPNNQTDWDHRLDPQWERFCDVVGRAAHWCRKRGWRTVLGGLSPVDAHWLRLVGRQGLLEHFDVVGIHGFPGTWDFGPWRGWDTLLTEVRAVVAEYSGDTRVWISEAGCASDATGDEDAQVEAFAAFAAANVQRGYWYAVQDLDPARDHQGGGFHSDERHYHMGLRTWDGRPKRLLRLLRESGVPAVAAAAAGD